MFGSLWLYQTLLNGIIASGEKWGFNKEGGFVFGPMIVILSITILGTYMLVRVYEIFPPIDPSKSRKENGLPLILAHWGPIIKDIQDGKSRVEGLILAFISYAATITAFAVMYWFIDATEMKCFIRPTDVQALDAFRSFYFSVITMATVGYGDIYPICTKSQAVVMFEIFAALLYAVFLFSIAVDSTKQR
jgi:hypothetical protein